MVSVTQPQPGTRWVIRRGKHAGNEIVVDHATDTSVFFTYGRGGDNWGNQKADDSKVHRSAREAFFASYVPARALSANGTRQGTAFRRVARPKPQPAAEPQMPLAMTGIVMTGATPLNIEVTIVTPEMAKRWLERGGINRTTSARRVSKYAGAMRRGEWKLTGEGIKLDAEGRVRDGRHRLMAIVASGMPIQSLVVRNLEDSAFDVLDSGRPRSASDVLGMHGYPSRIALAAAARGLIMIERFGRYAIGGKEADEAVSTPIILDYVAKHRDLLVDAIHCAELLHKGGLAGGIGLYSTFFAMLLRVDAEATHQFAEALATGTSLDKDSPILRFRNRMIADRRIPSAQIDREVHLAIAIKTWNAWRKGEAIHTLIWRGEANKEPFPVPV